MKQRCWFITFVIIGTVLVSGCTTIKISESTVTGNKLGPNCHWDRFCLAITRSTATGGKPESLNRSTAHSPQTRAQLKQLEQRLNYLNNKLAQIRIARKKIFMNQETLLARQAWIRQRIPEFGKAYRQLDVLVKEEIAVNMAEAQSKNLRIQTLKHAIKALETIYRHIGEDL